MGVGRCLPREAVKLIAGGGRGVEMSCCSVACVVVACVFLLVQPRVLTRWVWLIRGSDANTANIAGV